MTKVGDWRYFVEYLDLAKGVAAMMDRGGDPDVDTMWDFCEQGEITVRRRFLTKLKAVNWARRNKKLDVFSMPRIVEETFVDRQPNNDRFFPVQCWERTGYWEADGKTEIEVAE
jgi:hypothetical protein